MEKSKKTEILREEYPLNLMKAMEAAKTPHRGVFGVVPQPPQKDADGGIWDLDIGN